MSAGSPATAAGGSTAPAVAVRALRYGWSEGTTVLAVDELTVEAGESVFIHGPSGCGKSTLLGLIGGVLVPTAGTLQVLGEPLHARAGAVRDRLRGERMGFVFQQFNLLPYLDGERNIGLPGMLFAARRKRAEARSGSVAAEVERLARALGLEREQLAGPAHRLSMGQQQRVAAARALFGAPELVIADEPTSALDAVNQVAFLTLLQSEVRASGAALIVVSHDLRLADRFDRVVDLASVIERTLGRLPRGADAGAPHAPRPVAGCSRDADQGALR